MRKPLAYRARNRQQAGQRINRRGGVLNLDHRIYKVRSAKAKGGRLRYTVCLAEGEVSCSCADFKDRGLACKHIYAALDYEADHGMEYDEPVIDGNPIDRSFENYYKDARRSYLQPDNAKRSLMDLAYSKQDSRVIELAADLCNTLGNVIALPVAGHPKTAISARIFCMLLKVMLRRSTRVMHSIQERLIEAGSLDLESPIHRNSFNNYFKDANNLDVLNDLFVRTIRPIRKIETAVMADATGFSSTRTDNWVVSDHGSKSIRKKTVWDKLHAMVGLETGLFTAYRVTDNTGEDYAGDSTNFLPMLKDTAQTLTIKEVYADGAYAGEDKLKAIIDLGAWPYINITKEKFNPETKVLLGPVLADKLLKQQYTEEFRSKFPKRNRIEGWFSVLKRLNDPYMWCRGDAQRTNEMVCKLICHNLRRLAYLEGVYGDEVRFAADSYFQPKAA